MSNTEGISDCCLTGHLHSGTPKGKTEELFGHQTYVSGTEKAKTIVAITDIFGPNLPNVQLLADEIADQGFRVLVPDLSHGDWVSPELLKAIAPQKSDPEPDLVTKATSTAKVGANLGPWLVRNREANIKPVIDKYYTAVRGESGVKKLGAIGFCWGGRYAILLGQKGADPQVDAVVAQHPSFLSVPGEVESLAVPTQINVGDSDAMMSFDDVKKSKAILEKASIPAQVNIIPDAAHGFSVRGDQNEDKEKKQKDQATENAVKWFKKHLA